MVKPQKPTNLRPYRIDIVISGQRFTKVEINPLIETVKHPNENITDELILYLLKQLDGERVKPEPKRYYKWTYYKFSPLYNWESKAYKLVWCVADDEPKVIGLMDCYRQRRKDKK